MKEFYKKAAIIGIIALVLVIISLIFANKIIKDNIYLQNTLNTATLSDFVDDQYINDFQHNGTIVASGNNIMRVTPNNAYIKSGIIYVEATLKNSTSNNYKLNNYGIITTDKLKSTIYHINFDDKTILKGNDTLDVVFSVGAYDIMDSYKDFPNSMGFQLGVFDKSDNYSKEDITFTISWLYDQPIY